MNIAAHSNILVSEDDRAIRATLIDLLELNGTDVIAARACVRFWAQDNGPGLSIVRRIVGKLKGRVGVESQPGAGSRFWFELPLES